MCSETCSLLGQTGQARTNEIKGPGWQHPHVLPRRELVSGNFRNFFGSRGSVGALNTFQQPQQLFDA